MKKIVVTGGAGFLGSNLVAKLLGQGHQVFAVDNLITGREKNIEQFYKFDNFYFIEADVSHDRWWSTIKKIQEDQKASFQIDEIYHLASPASPPKYQAHPLVTLHVNTIGTEAVLKVARSTGASVLYASTSEVYGDPLEHPQKESYWGNANSFGPRACYDEAKRCGEAICYTYFHQHEVKVKVVRIFNTYGPNMDPSDGRVISNFVTQALQGQKLTVYGDGSQTRSYCFVEDMIEGFVKYMESDVVGEVINLGNPEEKTVLETAKLVSEKVAKWKGEANKGQDLIEYKPTPENDPQRRQPDISKAKKLLGWEPKVDFKEGLSQTIEYFANEI